MAAPVSAKTFRFANDGDVNSMDPYARNETFLLTFMSNVYEPLIRRGKSLELQPALATEWSQIAPEIWRFKLRHGVKFQDGTPFNADDVVFSYNRVRMDGSNLKAVVATIKSVSKVDDYTIDMTTDGSDPILPEEITTWCMMSKVWAEKNNAVQPADLTKSEDFFASRHANGTGPFILKDREPEVKTTLVANPDWWDKPEHNLSEVIFEHIANDATRVAALLSGEIDMMYTVPTQDIEQLRKSHGIKILETPELRTIFLGFDQSRAELLYSSVKGKNPFKDVRVRRAFYQAIDEDAIKAKVMRGSATPTGLMIAPGINGFDKSLNDRYPHDEAAAKKLLADAGYPNGFEVGMDCPTDRYVNDEQICQAVANMLARIGVKVNLTAQTRSKYFAKILGPDYDTSFYMLGWTPATYDAHNALFALIKTRTGASGGELNDGSYSNPKIDALIDRIGTETDQAKRNGMIDEAINLLQQDVGVIPLHQQVIVWASKNNVQFVQMADDYFPYRYIVVK